MSLVVAPDGIDTPAPALDLTTAGAPALTVVRGTTSSWMTTGWMLQVTPNLPSGHTHTRPLMTPWQPVSEQSPPNAPCPGQSAAATAIRNTLVDAVVGRTATEGSKVQPSQLTLTVCAAWLAVGLRMVKQKLTGVSASTCPAVVISRTPSPCTHDATSGTAASSWSSGSAALLGSEDPPRPVSRTVALLRRPTLRAKTAQISLGWLGRLELSKSEREVNCAWRIRSGLPPFSTPKREESGVLNEVDPADSPPSTAETCRSGEGWLQTWLRTSISATSVSVRSKRL
mmetsp:Transcript_32979/g.66969  ORF Transcript_32979/g.66969 Transcript_32979/m.66969 type:complete len:285 (-) Transcript_32979:250-1104(-)